MASKEDWEDFWYNSDDVKPKRRKTLKFNPLGFIIVLESLMIIILLTLI